MECWQTSDPSRDSDSSVAPYHPLLCGTDKPLLDEASEPIREPGGGGDDIVPTEPDIVQFTTQVFYADEDDGKVRITAMRLGRGLRRCSVHFRTKDGSAKAGDQYEAAEGTLVFEEGKTDAHFDVVICDDDTWHATNEFKLQLDRPQGCVLGNYLHSARVKILDNNAFPSDKYKEQVAAGRESLDEISGGALFWEYFKLNFQHQGMWWRTSITVVCDQLHNLNVLISTWMSMYMVDVVFNKDATPEQLRFFHDHVSEVYLMAFLYVLPIGLMHIWDIFRVKIDVMGNSQGYLMTNIVRRYMNLSEDSRILLSESRLQVAILDDSKMIAAGYCAVLDMVKSLGTVSVLTIYTLHSTKEAWMLVVSMPALMFIFLMVREFFGVHGDETSEKNALLNLVNEMLKNYKLIVSYVQRPRINDMVAQRVHALREKKIPLELTAKQDEYFPLWMGAILSAVYVIFNGPHVLAGSGHTSLGSFLATISVIRDIAGAFSLLYSGYLKLAETFDPMKEITWVFSLKTDLKVWQGVTAERNRETVKARANAHKDKHEFGPAVAFPVDRLKIRLTDASFFFDPKFPVFSKVNLAIDQGSIVAVSGKTNSGKSTMLNIIAHSLFPVSGKVFVPGHLRMLQVDIEALIFESWTPLDNLGFGLPMGEEMDTVKVLAVLEELAMQETLRLVQNELQLEEEETEAIKAEMEAHPEKDLEAVEHAISAMRAVEAPWHERLSSTEKSKFCLARAMIANPEVLVLHKPFRNFRDDEKRHMMQVVYKHVHNRGIGMPEERVAARRPRTVIYSTVTDNDSLLADLIWRMDPSSRTVTEDRDPGMHGNALDRMELYRAASESMRRTISKRQNAEPPRPDLQARFSMNFENGSEWANGSQRPSRTSGGNLSLRSSQGSNNQAAKAVAAPPEAEPPEPAAVVQVSTPSSAWHRRTDQAILEEGW